MNHEYEKARIAALESLDILDTSPSEQLDELTKAVQEVKKRDSSVRV